jgi:hypothetical protein
MPNPNLTIDKIRVFGEHIIVRLKRKGKNIRMDKSSRVLVSENDKAKKINASEMEVGQDLICYNCKKFPEKGVDNPLPIP